MTLIYYNHDPHLPSWQGRPSWLAPTSFSIVPICASRTWPSTPTRSRSTSSRPPSVRVVRTAAATPLGSTVVTNAPSRTCRSVADPANSGSPLDGSSAITRTACEVSSANDSPNWRNRTHEPPDRSPSPTEPAALPRVARPALDWPRSSRSASDRAQRATRLRSLVTPSAV